MSIEKTKTELTKDAAKANPSIPTPVEFTGQNSLVGQLPTINLGNLAREQRREVYVFLVLAGLVFRKDGSGTGAGLARTAINYVDTTLAELERTAQ